MILDPARPVTLLQPPHVSFGAGCVDTLSALLTQRKLTRALILATRSALPTAQGIAGSLRSRGIDSRIVSDLPAEPTVAAFETTLAAARTTPVDAVIGLGGGSALDVAKLVAALHDRPERVNTFFGSGLLPPRRTFLVCLPTTAGAGSEVSPNAILLDETDRLKKAVVSPWLVPDAALVDPQLALTLPAATTAATGIDALVHCIEAYANRFAHPAVDLYALEGVRLISSHLARAVRNGADLEARGALALGSLYGGLCLGPVNTAAVHALAYPLSGLFGLPHGLANALLLTPVLRFNLPAAPDRYAAIARAMGIAGGMDDAAAALAGIERLEALCTECGLPRRLSDAGIPESSIPQLAEGALRVQRLLKNNPRTIELGDAVHIYRSFI